MKIPPGTQSFQQFRLKNKGVSILRQNRRGDMYVEINVEIPVNLTNKQKEIIKKFEQEGVTNTAHSPKSKDFFSKIKKAWQDFK